MTLPNFSQSLEKYAELTVKVGLNLQPGQRLMIGNPTTRGVQLHAAPLVRQIALSAYKAGARYVDVIWGDEALTRIRFQHAPRDSFHEYSSWHATGMDDILKGGDAHLSLRSNNPDLLSDQDPTSVSVATKTHLEQVATFAKGISRNAINWCVITAAGHDWAARIFPDIAPEERVDKLWEDIFAVCRVDLPDPVSAWKEHIQDLLGRSSFLNEKKFTSLKYKAPGTDLTVGLPEGHRWISARMPAENGIEFTANLPTEEMFTIPHKDRTEGTVHASMPLSYSSSLIEDFNLTFEKGRVVKFSARKGEDVLRRLVETDEGAARIGEAALVPHNSPVAQRGHLFYDALIDENAACHLALGYAFRFNLDGGKAMSDEEFGSHGGNRSLLHADFMIGSGQMDIDGVHENGITEPLMRDGKWAFDV